MLNLFTTISKYLCLLLMVLYCYCNFRYLSMSDEDEAEVLSGYQIPIILLIHFLCSIVLILNIGTIESIIFFLAQGVFLVLYPALFRRIYHNANPLLLNNMTLLLCFGLIMLERLDFDKAVKQFVIILASSILSFVIPVLIDKIWDFTRFRYLFTVAGLALLTAVLVIGVRSYGAKMSISIGGFSFQASEVVKISFVFANAGFLYLAENKRDYLINLLIAGGHMLILVGCRDLGTALIFFVSYLFMLYIATNRKEVLGLGCGAMSLAAIASYFLFSHVRTRIYAWRDPWADIDNRGYQITQSLFAIGTGGFFGLGLFQGLPNKIPIVEKDFIISAISEEMGAITAICLVLICLGCFMQMMMIATYMEFDFYKLVAVGLGMQYILQVFLTIGGAIKFIPSTGVTLPFVSYGGSSMVASFMVFSIIQALYIVQGNEDEAEEEEMNAEFSEADFLNEDGGVEFEGSFS